MILLFLFPANMRKFFFLLFDTEKYDINHQRKRVQNKENKLSSNKKQKQYTPSEGFLFIYLTL